MASDKLLKHFIITDEHKLLYEEYCKSKLKLYNSIFSGIQEKFKKETDGKVVNTLFISNENLQSYSKPVSDPELKLLYKKLMRVHHPDKGGELEICKKITKMYEKDDLQGLKNIELGLNLNIDSLQEEIYIIEQSWAFQYCVGSLSDHIKSMFIKQDEFEESIKKREQEFLKKMEIRDKNEKIETEILEKEREEHRLFMEKMRLTSLRGKIKYSEETISDKEKKIEKINFDITKFEEKKKIVKEEILKLKIKLGEILKKKLEETKIKLAEIIKKEEEDIPFPYKY
jgi:hypothetical protein